MTTSLVVANTLIMRGMQEQRALTPLHLQKLTYLMYARYLQQTGEELFSEQFGPWKHGPVLTGLYHIFKEYGGDSVTKLVRNLDGSVTVLNENDDKVKQCLDEVWCKFSHQNALALSNLTHKPDGAWYKAYHAGSSVLDKEDIRRDGAILFV